MQRLLKINSRSTGLAQVPGSAFRLDGEKRIQPPSSPANSARLSVVRVVDAARRPLRHSGVPPLNLGWHPSDFLCTGTESKSQPRLGLHYLVAVLPGTVALATGGPSKN
jgi:hypothetical protein